MIDNRCYDSGKYLEDNNISFQIAHKPRNWVIKIRVIDLGYKFVNGICGPDFCYTLIINNVPFTEMAEAPPRERAALARSAVSLKMHGPIKSAKFGLMRKGEYVGVSIVLNTQSKFGKLAVGKHLVTAKQLHSGDKIFPLSVAVRDKAPIEKV